MSSDPTLVSLLGTALGELARGATTHGGSLPDVAAVYLAANQVVLRPAGPPAGPPPSPWRPDDDGRAWVLDAAQLRHHLDGAQSPYPALAVLGAAQGWWVLIDMAATSGLVSVSGDAQLARRVVRSIALELSSAPWSIDCAVTMVGLGDDRQAPTAGRLRSVASLGEVVDELEAAARRASMVVGQLDVPNLATGRCVDRGRYRAALRPQVVVLAEPPPNELSERVLRLVGHEHSPVVMICVGDSPFARWSIRASAAMRLEVEPLALVVAPVVDAAEAHVAQLRRVQQATLTNQAVEILFTAANLDARLPAGATPGAVRAGGAEEQPVPGQTDEPAIGEPGGRAIDKAPSDAGSRGAHATPDWVDGIPQEWRAAIRTLRAPVTDGESLRRSWPAAVEIALLGPALVTAPGPVEDAHRPQLAELVIAAAAAHGLREAMFRDHAAADGECGDVTTTLRRLHAWLGVLPDGTPRLQVRGDGGWSIPTDLRVDVQLFAALVGLGEPKNEPARLRTALAMIRGCLDPRVQELPGLVGFPELATAAALRAAQLEAARGRVADAEWALRQGLRLLPGNEVLWRELLMLRAEQQPAAVPELRAEMIGALNERGTDARLERDTTALLERVMAGTPPSERQRLT